VTTSTPAGTAPATRSRRARAEMPSDALASMLSKRPTLPNALWAVVVSKMASVAPEAGDADHGELLRRSPEEHLHLVAESERVGLGGDHVDHDLAGPLGLTARPQGQRRQVGIGPVEAEGRRAGGGDCLARLVDELGVAADRAHRSRHAGDTADDVEDRGGQGVTRRVGRGVGAETGGGAHRHVGAGGDLVEQGVEGLVDRVGEHERAGDEADAQHHGHGGQEQP